MKKCLIVVDYQNDFVTGSLGFPQAKELDSRIAAKIDAYHQNGDDVLFTFDTHGDDYLTTREGRALPIAHCLENTPGHDLYGKTAACRQAQDRCFYKSTYGSDTLFDYLRANAYQSIELVGLVSNICVLSNAVLVKTAQPETQIFVDAACTDSNDKALHRAALQVMQGIQIDIINERE